MTKIKYYYKDEDGSEVLARTSDNEYHYYCFGKCSKKIDNVDSELKRIIRSNENWLNELVNWENKKHSKYVLERWGNKEEREESIRRTKEDLSKLYKVRIYELYTK